MAYDKTTELIMLCYNVSGGSRSWLSFLWSIDLASSDSKIPGCSVAISGVQHIEAGTLHCLADMGSGSYRWVQASIASQQGQYSSRVCCFQDRPSYLWHWSVAIRSGKYHKKLYAALSGAQLHKLLIKCLVEVFHHGLQEYPCTCIVFAPHSIDFRLGK